MGEASGDSSETLRLIMCCLCPGGQQFACTARHRRTYMRVHLEKAHRLDAKQAGLVRKVLRDGHACADWVVAGDDGAKRVLFEVDVDLVAGDRAVQPADPPEERPANWSAEALRELYSARSGASPFL